MVTESDDKWSYGRSAEPEQPAVEWPPNPDATPGIGDTVRLSTGRFTSPSLGSYDPSAPHPLSQEAGGDQEEQYFDQYGYGDDYGDGLLEDDVDEDHLESSGEARRNAIEWAVVLVGAVLLALLLRAVLLQAFWIPSPSMESTLLVRDRVLVNKLSYRVGDPGRGDVIVFRRTDEEVTRNPELPRDVIKRVIALPGETIEIRDNQVLIDGDLLLEPYLDPGVITSDYGPEVVPADHLFVMGDNRELSLDSRFDTGPVSEERVVGRAFFLFWPLSRLGPL